MNKYEKAFENIIKIDSIVDKDNNLSIIMEAFEKAALYDAINNKPVIQKKEASKYKVSGKCPICGSEKTFILGETLYSNVSEPYTDIDGNLCQNTNGGENSVKCIGCGTVWKQPVKPTKIILKEFKKPAKKK